MKVFVYWNLHKKCWSIKALEGEMKGRVILHLSDFVLSDVTFKVSEAGRQRVLREKRKNVHAGVVGKLIQEIDSLGEYVGVTYNPYLHESFVLRETGCRIDDASICFSKGKQIFVKIT